MAHKHQLDCCALCQMTANDWDSPEELKFHIDKLKADALKTWNRGNRDSGERAVFTIVSPGEYELEHNLKDLGFKHITTFPRRKGYPAGELKMYFLKW